MTEPVTLRGKRRSPGALPPPLSPAQQAAAAKCRPIALRLARHYARRTRFDLSELESVADEALLLAVAMHDPDKGPLDPYVWLRVRGTLKNHVRKARKDQGLGMSHVAAADAAADALDTWSMSVEDSGNVFEDTEEALVRQFEDVADDAVAALVVGAVGYLWHMRGEAGLVEHMDEIRTSKRVHDAVAGLPAAQATVIELRFFQGKSIEDVAATTGLSMPKVTRLVGQAIRLLRARLVPART